MVAILIAIGIGKLLVKKDADMGSLVQIAGVAVVLGHTFNIFDLKVENVATSLGILLLTNWQNRIMFSICIGFNGPHTNGIIGIMQQQYCFQH